ncbi:hypothetical protein [Hymenobacter sp. GOD-10R]|uniref:hypothetical protein n=1 Tax=Hymenobacter sp. GOD-10R TaxID=3093922 RepID=UPI002D77339E|nr:hypothetical protein [Hymenobacter sp. GOD-10R]WRQ31580.1 hypothetical protein SD425_28195 [Hymenobacter sp. GOD-10R]
MRKRTSFPVCSATLATQRTAFWQGVAQLEHKYEAYFQSTPSRRSVWPAHQPSTLAENLVLQCQIAPVRLSLHPSLPKEIVEDRQTSFQQIFGCYAC